VRSPPRGERIADAPALVAEAPLERARRHVLVSAGRQGRTGGACSTRFKLVEGQNARTGMSTSLVGRDDELALIQGFVERVEVGRTGLILSGEPGIGKTALWEAAVELCQRDIRVLLCRCLETEASLSFGGLVDLVGSVLDEVAPALPPPRRRALEVALLLSEPDDEPVSPRAVGLGLLDVLRALAGGGPLVIAVDDMQWLDSSSSRVLQMALHRLGEERVGFLATVRAAAPDAGVLFGFERLFSEAGLRQVWLGGLSLGALHRLLRERVGREFTRPELVRLQEATAGNPYFALELGRELVRTGTGLLPRQPLPVPATLRALLERRLDGLPAETRPVLLGVAALARPTVDVLVAAQSDTSSVMDALDIAAREHVIELDGSRIRFTHPLLASACYERAALWERREVHRTLAAVLGEGEERVRHRALAATGEDGELASDLEAAAIIVSTRGSYGAAELLELAAELTPRSDGSGARRRQGTAALFYDHAGETQHAVALLEQLLANLPEGGERADALLLLAGIAPGGACDSLRLCDEALGQAAHDLPRTIRILASRATTHACVDLAGALADGRAAVQKAELLRRSPISTRARGFDLHAPAGLLRAAIARLAYVETCALAETAGLLERGVSLEATGHSAPQHVTYWDSPSAMLAHRLMFRDELDRARAILEAKEAQLTSDMARRAAQLHLTWLEWLGGRWRRALEHAIESLELAGPANGGFSRAKALQAAALVEAHLGHVEDAQTKASEALERARALSDEITAIESLAVLGHLELARGDIEAATRYLRELPARLISLGWNDPSSPLWPDAIEALVRYGDLTCARTYVEQYEDRALRASRRSLSCAARCRALLSAAEDDLPAAHESLARALDELDGLHYPFEQARTLLALGQVDRQARRRRAGREALEQALGIFEELGARLWSECARDELRRISGRPAGSKRLTETEQRVASLAGQGLSNKEIAATLFVSVHTVEAHLTRVYRKLGVKSRTALAHRLESTTDDALKM
jgi:DNA-binding CsgD family transcriptional regulator